MPKADISSDHGGMLALREAFELLHELPDVLRLNHPGFEEIFPTISLVYQSV